MLLPLLLVYDRRYCDSGGKICLSKIEKNCLQSKNELMLRPIYDCVLESEYSMRANEETDAVSKKNIHFHWFAEFRALYERQRLSSLHSNCNIRHTSFQNSLE